MTIRRDGFSSWDMRMTGGGHDPWSTVRAGDGSGASCGNLATLLATLEGACLPAGAASVINTAARTGPMTRQLDGPFPPIPAARPSHAPAWHWHTPVTVRVLSAVVRDAIEVLSVEDGSRLILNP